jgi:predicted GNAT family acetyltransferase
MVNPELRNAPTYSVSPDLQIHWYEPGDEESWIAIHKLADQYNTITPQLFSEQFAHEELGLSERQCYLFDKTDQAVATATAWAEQRGPFSGFGKLHWVAVIPKLHNRGIGKMVVSVACQRLLALGHTRAFLVTDTRRPAAIHLYETFGFRITDYNRQGQQDN